MVVYLIFLGIVIMQWLLFFLNRKIDMNNPLTYKQRKNFVILVCIELICFAGMRAINIGADTGVYINALEYYKELPYDTILKGKLVYPFDFEIGYFVLTKICAFFSLSATEFLFLIAIIIYVPVCKFILKYSEDPLISLLVYFSFGYFGYSLGIFRQMIAISIVLLGFKYVQEHKLFKYIIVVMIAMIFHTTAIIMFPFYWISRIRIRNKLKWIFVFEVIFFRFARTIVMLSVKFFPKYEGYVNGIYDIQGGSYTMLILLNIILIAAYYILNKAENRGNEILHISMNALVTAIYLQILGYSMGIFGRIVSYYSIYLIILIPILVNQYFKKNRILIHFMAIIGLVLIFCILIRGNNDLCPYLFIWS